jgi:hypothetical protein
MRKSRYSKSIDKKIDKQKIENIKYPKSDQKEDTKYTQYDSTSDSGFLSTLLSMISIF